MVSKNRRLAHRKLCQKESRTVPLLKMWSSKEGIVCVGWQIICKKCSESVR